MQPPSKAIVECMPEERVLRALRPGCRSPVFGSATFSLLTGILFTQLAAATTWQVGPTRAYKTPGAVQALVASGDTIAIDAATYSGDVAAWTAHNLTLKGIGGRPSLQSTGTLKQDKAIWVISGTNTTVENIEFSNARLPSAKGGNGAGIRAEGAMFTMRNCYLHDNDDGILVSDSSASDVLFEYCEFARNGYTNTADNPGGAYVGYAHNLYVNTVRSFTLRYSYSHDARGEGHLLKSRANANYILGNRLTEEAGSASYEVHFPQGGLCFLIGNLIEKGTGTVNHSRIVSFSDEGTKNAVQNLFAAHNTIVNDLTAYSPTFFWIDSSSPSPSGRIVNNLLIGPGPVTNGVGIMNVTNNLALTYTARTQLVDSAGFDYHPIPFAKAIDMGVTPGVYSNVNLTPAYEYVHPATTGVRQVEAALDLGAYECTDANGNSMEDNWERAFFGGLTNALGAASADWDGDGMNNLPEYLAGTDPTNRASYLHLTGLTVTNGTLSVQWQGGTSVWQYLEYKGDLAATGTPWIAVFTNPPPTPANGGTDLATGTNAPRYYRLRTARP